MNHKQKSILKLFYWIASIYVVSATSVALYLLNFGSHTVYPVDDISKYEVGTYHEELDSNWSQSSFDIVNNKIQFSYKLTTARPEPFAAFYFRDADINRTIVDVKDFTTFRIHLKAEKAQRIPITLRFHNKSYINLEKNYPEIPITSVIDYENEGFYDIALKHFEIADWWLRYHGIEKGIIKLDSISELKYLAIGSCLALETGLSDKITIGKVEFINDNSLFYSISVIILVLITIIWFILFKINGSKKTILVAPIEVTDAENPDDLFMKIKIFIGKNYSNSELSASTIHEVLGISPTQIRDLFKSEMQTTFKNYLKEVRLEEIKRLLRESDLTISEIAYKCGFNDIPYFNRVFKSETGYNPKDYKKEFSKK